MDSLLEETGFEPLVPVGTTKASRGLISRLPEAVPRSRASSEVLAVWHGSFCRRQDRVPGAGWDPLVR
jgi:hypothetical protein